MTARQTTLYVAFAGPRRIASGPLPAVARAAKDAVDRGFREPILVFDNATSLPLELDLRGSPEEVARRYATAREAAQADTAPTQGRIRVRGPGRPKLGVVGREVTLLPRHWAWLGAQRGGASATLRRLVDQARRETAQADGVRRAQDATYRFLVATVGNEPGFEEAVRALYGGDASRFAGESEPWPADFRDHARSLANRAFSTASGQEGDVGRDPQATDGAVRSGEPRSR
jgi:hypothetical protein